MEKPCRRRKIEFIEDSMARRRSVTFVKRRGGLFRKASELGVLCGAQCAIITFSERGTPFVSGHPSADAVIDRFVRGGVDYGHRIPSEAVGISNKKRKLNNNNNNSVECWRRRFWWDDDKLIDDMDKVEELELYTSKVRELRKKVRKRMEEVTAPAPQIDNHDATTLIIQNPILSSENNDDCFFSPGDEHESPETISNTSRLVVSDESPETISSSSSSSSLMMITSSTSCCTGGSSSNSDGDDNNDVFEFLDELVPSKSVVSSSSSGYGDFWQMMMMMETDREEENQMIMKDITATYNVDYHDFISIS